MGSGSSGGSVSSPGTGSTSGSAYGQSGTSGSSGSGAYGSTPPSGSATGSAGSMGSAGSPGASGSATADSTTGAQGSLRTVSGSVAKVDQDSITLDQSAGGVTLTVDSQTQVTRNGRPTTGISSIKQGENVRASFDPASNRADKIEVMGKKGRHPRKTPSMGGDSSATPPPK
jgi:hypothetical protein